MDKRHRRGVAVVPVCTDLKFDFPENLILPDSEIPNALLTTPMGIAIERALSMLNALQSCGDDYETGFTLHHKDVMSCLDTIEANIKIVDKLLERSVQGKIWQGGGV